MVRSMTGFGRAELGGESLVVAVEARSVNHRHLDIAVRLPRALADLEMEARRLIQSRLERGRVDITVQVTPLPGHAAPRVRVDGALAHEYLAHARQLGADLGLDGEVPLQWVLERPGVVRLEESETAPAAPPWPLLADALGRALDDLVARRTAEGERLAGDLRTLHAELVATVQQVAARAPAAAARREERLRDRLRGLLAGAPIEEGRILTEAAVWADKTDVTEELARLRAHLGEVTLLLDKGGPVGRPLDFLIQELNREVNTLGSKADDLELSQAALAAKSILERIREQVQNLE
ncbi:MAG TPA: YicC/YloC family endoribonuclease [Methylomirabilota bacterium]|nr:YicC/YloC family endoribonuclease [Methylomirabilota bacterium]